MELVQHARSGRWSTLFGYALFVGMMAVGYYYNVTFVQLGLVDLGTRLIGMSRQAVAMNMAWLALGSAVTALLFGLLMKRLGWGEQFVVKLRIACGVVLAQTLLTAVIPVIRSETLFLLWVVGAALTLGVGMPATFSMTVDLIPRRDRGYAAAAITGLSYFAAALFSSNWQIEQLRAQILLPMVAGTLAIGVMAFARLPLVERLAAQHTRPEFGRGRFVQITPEGKPRISRRLIVFFVLMFGVYFVDSLGFLRIIETPAYVEAAWLSPEVSVRTVIAITHVITALIGGVLYSSLSEKSLFLWIFGVFALVHLMYVFDNRISPGDTSALAMPVLYATAVSLYTVVNFAIWADISTPQTISVNAAVGVALSGWAATFLSTALSIRWQARGMPLDTHLRIVDSLAMLFFLFMLTLLFIPARRMTTAASPDEGQER